MQNQLMETELYLMNFSLDSFRKDYRRYFSVERWNHISSYKNVADRLRSVCTELLAKYLVAKKTSRNFEEISILRDVRGKPYIADSDLQISLSHSRNWIVCSVGNVTSGIDVEEDFSDALEIALNFFAYREYFLLKCLHGADLQKNFLRLWTLKESYGKFLGCGLSEELLKIDIEKLLVNNKNIACRNFYLLEGAVIGLCTAPFALPNDYILLHAEEIEPF